MAWAKVIESASRKIHCRTQDRRLDVSLAPSMWLGLVVSAAKFRQFVMFKESGRSDLVSGPDRCTVGSFAVPFFIF